MQRCSSWYMQRTPVDCIAQAASNSVLRYERCTTVVTLLARQQRGEVDIWWLP
jgi:hypothetical protein